MEQAAESNNESVIILGHIAPMDAAPNIYVTYNKDYLALINQYSHIIAGQFYGHTHDDEVRSSMLSVICYKLYVIS